MSRDRLLLPPGLADARHPGMSFGWPPRIPVATGGAQATSFRIARLERQAKDLQLRGLQHRHRPHREGRQPGDRDRLRQPQPGAVNQLTALRILSKDWSIRNNLVEPKDLKTKDENFAHRNTLGTGPFVFKSWTPDQKTVLEATPYGWGKGRYPGNVTESTGTGSRSAEP